jgi:hypothetical protein
MIIVPTCFFASINGLTLMTLSFAIALGRVRRHWLSASLMETFWVRLLVGMNDWGQRRKGARGLGRWAICLPGQYCARFQRGVRQATLQRRNNEVGWPGKESFASRQPNEEGAVEPNIWRAVWG